MGEYYDLFGSKERHDALVIVLEAYAVPIIASNVFPYCEFGKLGVGKMDWIEDCTEESVHTRLITFFHVYDLNPELRKLYDKLISSIVVVYPSAIYPESDCFSSEPVHDKCYTIDKSKKVLMTTDECNIVASRKFIDFLNEYGTQCMKFLCYAFNMSFFMETFLAVINPEQSNISYAYWFYILMASLKPVDMSAFPCNANTFFAMDNTAFFEQLSGTPDWQQRLTDEGFAFLNKVLFELLGLTTLPYNALEAYLNLVHRVNVKQPESLEPNPFPWNTPPCTFTLSTESNICDKHRFSLPLQEACTMTSPGFVDYVKKQWSNLVSHPWYGKNLNEAMMKLWDDYHSLCLLEPRGE
jgi:hypothetical protein